MATKFAKSSPAKITKARDRIHKQFTSYLLPFLMNTNTSCREDGWHTAANFYAQTPFYITYM